MTESIDALIEECLEKLGENRLQQELKNLILDQEKDEKGILTIISNAGTHPRASVHNRGEIYLASTGQIDFSSEEKMREEFGKILRGVAEKLKSRSWRKIYLVPFGPAVLAMQIKLLVYRILYIETVDVFHVGSDVYYDVEINLKEVAILAGKN